MRTLVQLCAVRRTPEPEVFEATVPAEAAERRMARLAKQYDTVFVLRSFTAKDALPDAAPP
jgi:hypothetical protein